MKGRLGYLCEAKQRLSSTVSKPFLKFSKPDLGRSETEKFSEMTTLDRPEDEFGLENVMWASRLSS